MKFNTSKKGCFLWILIIESRVSPKVCTFLLFGKVTSRAYPRPLLGCAKHLTSQDYSPFGMRGLTFHVQIHEEQWSLPQPRQVTKDIVCTVLLLAGKSVLHSHQAKSLNLRHVQSCRALAIPCNPPTHASWLWLLLIIFLYSCTSSQNPIGSNYTLVILHSISAMIK
ncbi:hypothetical protein AMTRI_Chr07g26940 [Amborella trichopoda]|uniref:Uncharacterized protein n=1 Tax=Amborella trichopoda TaxID=13333 RepID=W1NQI9_AMBTC|nr:hypothetical protein AMTR_s00120p00114500 [Amborella trichopoda]